MRVVMLQHQQTLLAGSEIRSVSTNLDDDDVIEYTGNSWGGSGR